MQCCRLNKFRLMRSVASEKQATLAGKEHRCRVELCRRTVFEYKAEQWANVLFSDQKSSIRFDSDGEF